MVEVVLGSEKKQEKYKLELSFNTIVETDFMEKYDEFNEVVNSFKKEINGIGREELMEDSEKDSKKMTKIIMRLFSLVRHLIWICLHENHGDEFNDERKAGLFVQRLMSEKKMDIIQIFDLIIKELEDSDFLLNMFPAEEAITLVPQDHLPKTVK